MNLLYNTGIIILASIDLNKFNFFIIDFNDSFTQNISSIAKEIGFFPIVVNYQNKSIINQIKTLKKKIVILLGPGPGNPDEYLADIGEFIKSIGTVKNIFLMGICLGHQLIWRSLGFNTNRAKEICHGGVKAYSLDESWQSYFESELQFIEVQRYNSLTVKLSLSELECLSTNNWLLMVNENELIMSARVNMLSMQFHPESVGTNFRELFFSPSWKFIYNNRDGLS